MRRAAHSAALGAATLGAFALLLMMAQVTLDVLGKYLLNAPFPATTEIVGNYYMVAAVFLPLALIEVNERPIVVDLMYNLAAPPLRAGMDVIGTACTLAFYLWLGWVSIEPARDAFAIREMVSGTYDLIVWPSRFLLPFGLLLAALALLFRLLDQLRGRYQRPQGQGDLF